MSRGYRILQNVRVSDSLRRDVDVTDGVCTDLELLGILPAEQMSQLLEAELASRGFERDADGKMSRTADGITVSIDTATGEAAIRIDGTETATVEGTKGETVDRNLAETTRKRLQDALRAELEQRMQQAEQDAQRHVSGKLEAALDDISRELDAVVNRVTAAALKQKASQLGQIKELTEDPEAGSLTIKVEV